MAAADRRGAALADLLRQRQARRQASEPEKIPYEPGVTRLAPLLVRPAILGFVASSVIVAGASLPTSPFTLKSVQGAWWFGVPSPSLLPNLSASGSAIYDVAAVYAGMILMLRVWYDVVRICSRHPGIPVRRLVPTFAAWLLPLLVVAPLFSRDLYSYAAQGWMVVHHLNPYTYGPSVMGQGPFVGLVDPLWHNVGSPYGPAFLTFAGWIVQASGQSVLVSVEGLRMLALIGTIAFAAAVPAIARSFGRDGATAFALVALNPLVLLHLVGGGHNDALMLGFLLPGYLLARRGHPLAGILVCAVGAAVKVPAMIGPVYIGWEWAGQGRSVRERVWPVAKAMAVTLATMAGLSALAGLGWGWIGGLTNPDTVRSWFSPATAAGLSLGKLVALAGLGDHTHALLTMARGMGFALAGVIGVVLLLRSEKVGPLKALGWSLIAVVAFSPVVQPWYMVWGIVFLAPVAERGVRRMIVGYSAVACFLGLPGARVLVRELEIASPLRLGAASLVLAAVVVLILTPRLRRSALRSA